MTVSHSIAQITQPIRSVVNAIFADPSPDSFVGPAKNRFSIPKGRTHLNLDFPSEVKTSEQKILYALWKEGNQPKFNLLLLCGTTQTELSEALAKLADNNRIKKESGCLSSNEAVQLFSLVR